MQGRSCETGCDRVAEVKYIEGRGRTFIPGQGELLVVGEVNLDARNRSLPQICVDKQRNPTDDRRHGH